MTRDSRKPAIQDECGGSESGSRGDGEPIAISVVIPARNAAASIGETLESLFRQTERRWEAVVVDDGSTDDTADIVAAVEDNRVRLVPSAPRGVCAARNLGVASSRASSVVFLDSDDEVEPAWLSVHLAHLGVSSVSRCGVRVITTDGHEAVVTAEPFRRKHVHIRGTPLPGSFALRREVFDAVGGYDEQLRYSENSELLMRVAAHVIAHDLASSLTDAALVRIRRETAGRDARYASSRAEAVDRILHKHGRQMRLRDRSAYHDHLAIGGTIALRRGDRRLALRYFLRAVAAEPKRLKAWGRLMRALVVPRRDRAVLMDGLLGEREHRSGHVPVRGPR